MKKLLFIVFLIGIFNINAKAFSQKSDTIILKDRDIVFIRPSLKNIDRFKEEYTKKYNDEDAFYTIADDANYYKSLAWEYLESLKIPYHGCDDDQVIGFIKDGKFVQIPKYTSSWYVIFYDHGKYKFVALIHFQEEYDKFFKP